MKKTLLVAMAIAIAPFVANSQTYDPVAGSALAGGELNVAYSSTIDASIPASIVMSGQDLLDQLPAALTGALALAGISIPAGASVPVNITSTVLTVDGAPSGVNASCSSSCTVMGGASTTITLSGTPVAAGMFTIDVNSSTTADADLSALGLPISSIPFGGSINIPGSPIPIPVPAMPGAMDSDGYSMMVVDPNGIKDLLTNQFDITLTGQNPFNGNTTLGINMVRPGVVSFDVRDLNGRIIESSSYSCSEGINNIHFSTNVATGNYVLVASFDGTVLNRRITIVK